MDSLGPPICHTFLDFLGMRKQCVPGIPPTTWDGDKAVSHGSPATRVWLNFESQLLLSWMSMYVLTSHYNYVLFSNLLLLLLLL